jgi:hypothetical protein
MNRVMISKVRKGDQKIYDNSGKSYHHTSNPIKGIPIQ